MPLEVLDTSWEALGWLLEALGRVLEASKRHLGPKTIRARIVGQFSNNKNGSFGGPSWRRFNINNRIFGGSKRVSKIKLIFKAFWHRFGDDFRGSGNVKNEVFVWKGCTFFDFRGLQDKSSFWMRFGRVWGRVFEAFWA